MTEHTVEWCDWCCLESPTVPRMMYSNVGAYSENRVWTLRLCPGCARMLDMKDFAELSCRMDSAVGASFVERTRPTS